MVLLVDEVDVDGLVGEQHAGILQARGVGGRASEMQHCAAKLIVRVHFERGGDVLARPRLASAGALTCLSGGGAVSFEEALEWLLFAEGKVDMEEGHTEEAHSRWCESRRLRNRLISASILVARVSAFSTFADIEYRKSGTPGYVQYVFQDRLMVNSMSTPPSTSARLSSRWPSSPPPKAPGYGFFVWLRAAPH